MPGWGAGNAICTIPVCSAYPEVDTNRGRLSGGGNPSLHPHVCSYACRGPRTPLGEDGRPGLVAAGVATTASPEDEECDRIRRVEIVKRITAATAVTQAQAKATVEAILAVIKDELQQGKPVILRGLGTFAVHAKRAQMGRNPQTGTAVEIPARRVVAFKAGKRLKQVVATVALSAVPAPPSRRAVPPTPERPRPQRPSQDVPASATRQRRRPRTRGADEHPEDCCGSAGLSRSVRLSSLRPVVAAHRPVREDGEVLSVRPEVGQAIAGRIRVSPGLENTAYRLKLNRVASPLWGSEAAYERWVHSGPRPGAPTAGGTMVPDFRVAYTSFMRLCVIAYRRILVVQYRDIHTYVHVGNGGALA